MSSAARGTSGPRPYSRQGGGLEKGRRPLTRGAQRGYYSEIIGSEASQKIGKVKQGPRTQQSTVWKSQREKHLPNVTRFEPPEDFLSQLEAQVYGPTTQLIASDEFSKRAWDPKVQIPYKVDSGKTPRKVEMERRRRQYARQAGTIDGLLHELKVNTQDLMPVADHTARALLDFSGKGHPTPTFPSFLPLEVFDNTEFDCRTPEEWVALGNEDEGVRKPVPGKALLPVLEPPTSPSPHPLTPTPPTGQPPSDISRPTRRFKGAPGSKSQPLPPLSGRHSPTQLGPRYEWVDVGMLEFDPTRKLYLVKRVHVPSHILEEAASREKDGEEKGHSSDSSSQGDRSGGSDEEEGEGRRKRREEEREEGRSTGSLHSAGGEGEAGSPAAEGGNKAPKPKTPQQQAAGERGAKRSKEERVESEDQIHYWVPRVRLMFAAEDPTVFAQRVAHAHLARQKTEALLRYHLYVDCMPVEGMGELGKEELERMLTTARSSPRLKETSLDSCSDALSSELQLDFTRTMNRILFDKTVTTKPGTFPFVTLPNPHIETVPQSGKHPDVPPFRFREVCNYFKFLSLTISCEALTVMEHVMVKCGRVCGMSLFHTGVSKHLKLPEFDQSQQQASVQVQSYLKETWVPNLRNAIHSSLAH